MDGRMRLSVGLFVLVTLGVLPTLWVAWWCRGRNRPESAEADAARWSARLAMRVSIGRREETVPGVVRYHNVAFCHPESGRCLAALPQIECRTGTSADGRHTSETVLQAECVEVAIDEFEELGRLIRHVLQGRAQLDRPLRLSVERIEVRAGREKFTFHRAWGHLQPLAEGMEAQLAWTPNPTADAKEPVLGIRVARNRQTVPPETGFEFTTGGQWMPIRLLARAIPGLARLGTETSVAGRLWAKRTAEGWQGEFSGQLKEIDLRTLLDPRLPLRLEGAAAANVQVARFSGGRLAELSMALAAGPGTASRSFLTGAAQHLQIAAAADWSRTGELIPYSQLALAVFLDQKGLRIQGQCPSVPSAVLLDSQQQPILGAASDDALPPGAIVQSLASPATQFVPASPQALELAGVLPSAEGAALAPAVLSRAPSSGDSSRH